MDYEDLLAQIEALKNNATTDNEWSADQFDELLADTR